MSYGTFLKHLRSKLEQTASSMLAIKLLGSYLQRTHTYTDAMLLDHISLVSRSS